MIKPCVVSLSSLCCVALLALGCAATAAPPTSAAPLEVGGTAAAPVTREALTPVHSDPGTPGGAADGFLEKGYYNRDVVIQNPETSPLAEAFLRAGVDVHKSTPYDSACFIFKIQSGPLFTVFIYYKVPSSSEEKYVGRFAFKSDPADHSSVQTQFINAFVPWMQNNAWSQ